MDVLVELENDSMKNTQYVFRAKVTRHCRLACVKGAVFRGVVVSECQPVTSNGEIWRLLVLFRFRTILRLIILPWSGLVHIPSNIVLILRLHVICTGQIQ